MKSSSVSLLSELEKPTESSTSESKSETSEPETEGFIYNSGHVVKLYTPVTICVVAVLILQKLLGKELESEKYLVTSLMGEDQMGPGLLENVFRNVAVVLGYVVGMTLLLLGAYYFRFYKTLALMLGLSTSIILGFMTLFLLYQMPIPFPVDYLTVAICLWNFAVVGTLSIHWQSPLIVRQFYMIALAVIASACILGMFATWTIWAVLLVLCLWDLFAVLAPCGPLRILVNTAAERNEDVMPSLVYSSGIGMVFAAENESSNEEEEENSIKLGLGDFIFYSVLIGKSAQSDWCSTISTYVAVLFGLTMTLVILLIKKQALPALPISIILGVVTFFWIHYISSPMLNIFSYNQILL